jgi:acetylglutamate kinase
MESITIVKVGGNLIDNVADLDSFLNAFAGIPGKTLLVHGGGKLATNLAGKLGLETKMMNGRRITDAENLKLVTMVYAGFVNKNIVASLHSKGKNALGICGCDLNIIKAEKRKHPTIDFGFVGDIIDVNVDVLKRLIDDNSTLVIAPITHDGNGQLLNTNADSIVTELAIALSKKYKVKLIYSFEKAGVLKTLYNELDVISELSENQIIEMQKDGAIHTGMMPKTDNAVKAAKNGVSEVIIGNLVSIQNKISAGTRILEL